MSGRAVAVGVCGCGSPAAPPGVHAEIVPGLCSRPEHARTLAARTGATRLVLGVCPGGASPHEFQAWVRRAGLDPFALELVLLEPGTAPERAALLLGAAVARARAFRGSEPEELRPRLLDAGARRSRRSLLALPPLTYEAIACVESAACTGCGVCVEACPAGAIRRGLPVAVDRDRCEGCGVCVSACPTGAVSLPGASLEQYEAELVALLEGGATDIVFACREDDLHVEPPWVAVRVPCAGMVTPGWALQALARGARRVRFAPCEDCPPAAAERVAARSRYVAAVRVAAPGARADGLLTLREPAATVRALAGAGTVSLADPASPIGTVTLRSESCTLCGTCAAACPTRALTFERGETEVGLSFDARRCVACGHCVAACPEAGTRTLGVVCETDSAALAAGRRLLARAELARCSGCGGAIAPARLLDRIEELLAPTEAQPLLHTLSTLCADCRAGVPTLAR